MEILFGIFVIILIIIGICILGVIFKIGGLILEAIWTCLGWGFSGCFSFIVFIFIIIALLSLFI